MLSPSFWALAFEKNKKAIQRVRIDLIKVWLGNLDSTISVRFNCFPELYFKNNKVLPVKSNYLFLITTVR